MSQPSLRITEIFYSLQGEARTVGLPTVFVRLTGCPLRCTYCDSEYAFYGGEWMHFDEILADIEKYGTKHVCVTGGEPLAQAETMSLLTQLCDAGYEVMLETSGAFSIQHVDPRVRVILDVKCPDSNMSGKMDTENYRRLIPGKHELKFVISTRSDFDWSVQLPQETGLHKSIECLVSPVEGRISPAELAEWVLHAPVNFRLQLQLHKLIWIGEGEER